MLKMHLYVEILYVLALPLENHTVYNEIITGAMAWGAGVAANARVMKACVQLLCITKTFEMILSVLSEKGEKLPD